MGELRWTRLSDQFPPFSTTAKLTGVRRQGIKYEQRAHEWLLGLYPQKYVPSPWFQFIDDTSNKIQWCQPDGLLIDVRAGRIVVVEIKLKHTSDAWWQLYHKYLPVVHHTFGPLFKYCAAEVVKWYDCAIPFPGDIAMGPDPAAAPGHLPQVTIWKP